MGEVNQEELEINHQRSVNQEYERGARAGGNEQVSLADLPYPSVGLADREDVPD